MCDAPLRQNFDVSFAAEPDKNRALLQKSSMGWLRSLGSIYSYVSFAEYRLFYRALSQQRQRPCTHTHKKRKEKGKKVRKTRYSRIYKKGQTILHQPQSILRHRHMAYLRVAPIIRNAVHPSIPHGALPQTQAQRQRDYPEANQARRQVRATAAHNGL